MLWIKKYLPTVAATLEKRQKASQNRLPKHLRPLSLWPLWAQVLLNTADIVALADLPSIEVLRSKLLGVIMAPATKLAATIATPGTQIARVLAAKVAKGE